jgi:P-type conjugative transfer protein TrbG
MPKKSPALLYAATSGATPFRFNLHVSDLGHTLIVGPSGAGKSTALGLIAAQWFRYPEEENTERWQQHLLAQRAQAEQTKREAHLLPAMITADKLNFDYRVTGGTEEVRPVRVFDDGAKTYIQMRPGIQNRETPMLLVVGSDGKGEMTNYRVQQQIYIVDRLFERARLVLGAGKKAQKVEITREQHAKG